MNSRCRFSLIARRSGLYALAALAAALAQPGATARSQAQEGGTTYDRQVNLLYTVNNLGYTDTCG